MNRAQIEIQVFKAIIMMKRKEARNMKTGPKKTALLKEIAKAQKWLTTFGRK
jgi:hypothetical protein